MIEYVHGDLFEAPVEALVNTVNTRGVMGAGLAKQFKERYPKMYAEYRRQCALEIFRPGSVMPIKIEDGTRQWVLNFATKDDWRDPSKTDYIVTGLLDLHRAVRSIGIRSLAVPPLGCGLGGLKWPDVRKQISQILSDLEEVKILVYEP